MNIISSINLSFCIYSDISDNKKIQLLYIYSFEKEGKTKEFLRR